MPLRPWGGHPISQVMPLHQEAKTEINRDTWYRLSVVNMIDLSENNRLSAAIERRESGFKLA